MLIFFFNDTATTEIYTLSLHDALPILGFTINPAYYRKTSYDPLKDFDPITVVAETPYLLVANASLPYAGSLKDFIAAAKAQDRKSTRLNSSHANISYAVFCLKKKIITM